MSTTSEQPSIPLTPFVVALMEQSARDTQWSVSAVLDAEKRRADRAEARLGLILGNMHELLAQPWTPSSDAIRDALYPSDELIKYAMENKD